MKKPEFTISAMFQLETAMALIEDHLQQLDIDDFDDFNVLRNNLSGWVEELHARMCAAHYCVQRSVGMEPANFAQVMEEANRLDSEPVQIEFVSDASRH